MPNEQFPLSKKDFNYFYSKVPRLTVEIIVKDKDNQIFLTKRAIPPCEGQWHLPGGTVFFGESLNEAVKRIAKRELGITVINSQNNGYIEYPSHYQNGLDSPVGLVFEVLKYSGKLLPNNEAKEANWFCTIPRPFHGDQDRYLLNKGYLNL